MCKTSITGLTLAVLFFSLPAAAGDDKSPNFTPRQMAHCMMARVKVSPTETYKAAFKACRAQFESASGETGTQTAMNNANSANSPKQ
jgi:hypothetical protein